jgi:plasmid stabilization system protein ParE
MAFQIVFKKRFINKLLKVQTYLEEEWGDQVAQSFLLKLDRRIQMLKQNPHLGAASTKVHGIRGLLITKHNILFYTSAIVKIPLEMFSNLIDGSKSETISLISNWL